MVDIAVDTVMISFFLFIRPYGLTLLSAARIAAPIGHAGPS